MEKGERLANYTGPRGRNRPKTFGINGFFRCETCGIDKLVEKFPRREDGSLRRLYCYDCKYKEDRRASLNYRYKINYGITLADFENMVHSQNGLCAICGMIPTGLGKNAKLHVDHDHKTNKVRQLICSYCNSGLGYFRDNTDILKSAIEYLIKHEGGLE